jgi:methylenetetrahydrofolate dehydrogenase (NADP+)/methenyltetrahydrofolate cyclohydrolase/formyltetrahydrofolate synthetase
MRLLESTGVAIAGARAAVIGRSDIVGKPVAALLLKRDATVTICHSKTRDLGAITSEADILVAAIGRPHFVTPNMVKPGAVVIDVGINRIDDPSKKSGTALVGDVDFAGALDVAGWITPVPGGVGPMTIAMLMQNTVTAAQWRRA